MTSMTASSDSKISLVMLVRYWYDFQNSEYDQEIPQSKTANNSMVRYLYDLHDRLFRFKDFTGRQSEVLV